MPLAPETNANVVTVLPDVRLASSVTFVATSEVNGGAVIHLATAKATILGDLGGDDDAYMTLVWETFADDWDTPRDAAYNQLADDAGLS
jgi:hypothetical protein